MVERFVGAVNHDLAAANFSPFTTIRRFARIPIASGQRPHLAVLVNTFPANGLQISTWPSQRFPWLRGGSRMIVAIDDEFETLHRSSNDIARPAAGSAVNVGHERVSLVGDDPIWVARFVPLARNSSSFWPPGYAAPMTDAPRTPHARHRR